MKIHLTDPRAKMPTQGSSQSSGLDLYSITTRTLRPGQRALFDLGFTLELPAGHEGQIRPRSGLALKHGVTVLNSPGTIDEDYRGPMGVLLINQGQEHFLVKEGMRIAQLVVVPCATSGIMLEEVKSPDALSVTDRGARGFGSTDEEAFWKGEADSPDSPDNEWNDGV